jgi:hypothetical protein
LKTLLDISAESYVVNKYPIWRIVFIPSVQTLGTSGEMSSFPVSRLWGHLEKCPHYLCLGCRDIWRIVLIPCVQALGTSEELSLFPVSRLWGHLENCPYSLCPGFRDIWRNVLIPSVQAVGISCIEITFVLKQAGGGPMFGLS